MPIYLFVKRAGAETSLHRLRAVEYASWCIRCKVDALEKKFEIGMFSSMLSIVRASCRVELKSKSHVEKWDAGGRVDVSYKLSLTYASRMGQMDEQIVIMR